LVRGVAADVTWLQELHRYMSCIVTKVTWLHGKVSALGQFNYVTQVTL
jgi:endonuclease/exonuclease/phosphatase family metal-dependent hydrolase